MNLRETEDLHALNFFLYQWIILRLPSQFFKLGAPSSGTEPYCSQPNVKHISAFLGKMNKTEIHISHYIHIHEYSSLFSHSVFLFCFKQHYFLSVYSEMIIVCYRMWWDEFPKWLSFDLMQVHMTDVCPRSLYGGCPCCCFTFPSVFQQLGEQLMLNNSKENWKTQNRAMKRVVLLM